MVSLFYLLAQTQQTRLPWGFLVLFGLMAVAAVGLLIYFMTRVRRTEKEAEEDWGFSSRGTLLTLNTATAPDAKKKPEARPEQVPTVKEPLARPREVAAPSEPEAPVVAKSEPVAPVISAPEPVKPHFAAESSAALKPEMPGEILAPAIAPQPVEIPSVPVQQPVGELHQQAVAEPVAQTPREPSHAEQPGSPFDQEIWSQLESSRPRPVRSEVRPVSPPHGVAGLQEPYEPPRIDPILPRKDQAKRVDRPAPEVRLPASASERPPASRARIEARPRVETSIRKPAAAAAGSVLGLPAEASAGPFIIDRARARADAVEVGTLANYDRPPDDKAGHSGTIALIVVIALVCGSLAAYLVLPPIHSRVDNWVAHVRGIDTSEPPKVVVQIFPAPYDNTKDPIVVKGSLQNISDQSLYGLVVTLSLQPRPGGDQATENAHVTPDELPAGQQGTYEFQIDGKKYLGYKIVGLKNKDGVPLGYNKPNQQQ